jgi:hypothetical protein
MRAFQRVLLENFDLPYQLDGLEIVASFSELEGWIEELEKDGSALPKRLEFFSANLKQIIRNSTNTIHIPPLGMLPKGLEGWLAESLHRISELTGVREFTCHPDGCASERWGTLLQRLPANLYVSVENMDFRKASFKTLDELKSLVEEHPQLRFTFDVCHWLELGQSLNSKEFLNSFKGLLPALSKIHFSVPNNNSDFYQKTDCALPYHYLYHGSSVLFPTEFLALIPDDVVWVLEGLLPLKEENLLGEEIRALRSLWAGDVDRVVGGF